jgi:adenylate cyclase
MAQERVERRLTAILAADVAGYSRLMGIDEEGTLAALKACRRELIDPKIAEHRGRIVKTTGDGALVEFASAVDAVRCALEIQRSMTERNAEIPEDHRLELRIGINVGDIIID